MWTNPWVKQRQAGSSWELWMGMNLCEGLGTLIQAQVRIKWWSHMHFIFQQWLSCDKPTTGGWMWPQIFCPPHTVSMHSTFLIGRFSIKKFRFHAPLGKSNWHARAHSCLATVDWRSSIVLEAGSYLMS